jgi:hypothetical protein
MPEWLISTIGFVLACIFYLSPAITIPLIWRYKPSLPKVDKIVFGIAWAVALSLVAWFIAIALMPLW